MESKKMSETVIALSNVQKSYGKYQVLDGVNMQVNKGDIYGLIGKNGAGKTTIFKIILGLSEFNNGELSIMGGKTPKVIAEGRRRIGFFIGSNFFPKMTAAENLDYYCRLKGIKNAKEEIARVLKIVGLDGVKKKVGRFSMGMKQRLGIGNAILGNPEVLILDEPANGLDPQGIVDVRNLVKRLNEEFGMTVIVSSHILSELQNTATRFGIVNNGTVAREITTADLESMERAVRISVDDLGLAKEALEKAGVKMLDVQHESNSLEQFYFNLVGGGNNA